MSEVRLQVKNLCKNFGITKAVQNVSFNVNKGEVHALIGENGSGKSTAIGCMLALLKYDKGTIQIFGKNMTPDSYDIKKEIGVVMFLPKI